MVTVVKKYYWFSMYLTILDGTEFLKTENFNKLKCLNYLIMFMKTKRCVVIFLLKC